MMMRHSIPISYPTEVEPIHVEQLQEYAVRTLGASCPHIIENELEVQYSKPVVLGVTTRQELHVQCPYCEDGSEFH